MALDSYANLKTEIAEWLDRDDLTSKIDTFIDLAEARHQRDIRIRAMLVREPLTIDDRYVDLPDGFLEIETVRILTNPVTVLQQVDIYEMNRIRQAGTGKPTKFAIHSQFEFDRDADQSYSGEIIYYAAQTPLSDSNTSNELLALAPDAYLYGSLLAASPYLMHDERIAVWGSLYNDCKDMLNKQQRASRKVGPLVARVAGATP